MDQALAEVGFVIERSREERRTAPHAAPPYLTEDGFVLYDRREGGDRRGSQKAVDSRDSKRPAVPDLLAQRMEELSALYGYVSAQAQAQAELAKQVDSDWYRPFTRKSANGV